MTPLLLAQIPPSISENTGMAVGLVAILLGGAISAAIYAGRASARAERAEKDAAEAKAGVAALTERVAKAEALHGTLDTLREDIRELKTSFEKRQESLHDAINRFTEAVLGRARAERREAG